MKTLADFEQYFEARIKDSASDKLSRAGALLHVVPPRAEWDAFLSAVRATWPTWKVTPSRYPSSLVVLYGGLAFYEYADTTFWPQFADAVGSPVPLGLYNRLNETYQAAVQKLGLRVIQHADRTSYVGSAIHHIGIPLSLWDGFLDICDWARVSEGWRTMSAADWNTAVTRISSSRKRLGTFLLVNRDGASEVIAEMLDARHCLIKDETLTLDGLKNICLIRHEYFDEVPETAEFLRPDRPESLIHDRPRLNWNEQKGSIGLHVPGISHGKLPATWTINGKVFKANADPTEYPLDSTAFETKLSVKLNQKGGEETLRLAGAKPWALFDVERSGYIVNSSRESFPLRGYALISSQPLVLAREGFEDEDYPANDPYQLKDGSSCFFTRLLPKDRRATLTIGSGANATTLRFRTRKRIEARLFFGREFRSAWYERNGEQLNVEGLPLICVLIPQGYFAKPAQTLKDSFKVLLDSKPGGGQWVHQGEALDDYDLFCWQWSDRPFVEARAGVKLNDLKSLGSAFKPLDITGKHTLAVEAQRFAIRFSYSLFIQPDKAGMARFWKNLPKKYLPMFLLTQSRDGLKSDELEFASPVIAPQSRFPYYLLKKYGDAGLLVQRGRNWSIRESRARIIQEADTCVVKFCGDPALLWALYRTMIHIVSEKGLPEINVSEANDALEKALGEATKEFGIVTSPLNDISLTDPTSPDFKKFDKQRSAANKLLRKSETMQRKKEYRVPPYLVMRWPGSAQHALIDFFKIKGVHVVEDLWSR